jgi:uroporphyrinogen decarboxylase
MDSRQRVFTALQHQQPDRVPIDYWAAAEVNTLLLKHFNFSTLEELLEFFNVDFRYLDGPAYVGPQLATHPDGSVNDHFGVPRKTVAYGTGSTSGTYKEVADYPLARARSVDEIESYPHWPNAEWFDYASVRQQARQAYEKGKVVVFMGDRLNRCAQLKPAMYLRGIEQILVDTILNPEISQAIFRRITEFYVRYCERVLDAADGKIDILFTGDDFGTQTSTFMSLDMWRRYLRPGFERFIEIGHRFNCLVAHHTCGSIYPLISDFIDCGLDILNPLQPDVANLDHRQVKRKFGGSLSFHGGISIQNTMPKGSPQDVINEVRERVVTLAGHGGYIFCTAHNLQIDTPLENILTLFRAYKEFGSYDCIKQASPS